MGNLFSLHIQSLNDLFTVLAMHDNQTGTPIIIERRLNLLYSPKVGNREVGLAASALGGTGVARRAQTHVGEKGAHIRIVAKGRTDGNLTAGGGFEIEREFFPSEAFVAKLYIADGLTACGYDFVEIFAPDFGRRSAVTDEINGQQVGVGLTQKR